MKHTNRESWLTAMAAVLIEERISPVTDLPEPKISYSITAPKSTGKGRILGECWNRAASLDGSNAIFITAALDSGESIKILSTLLHEQLHAYDDNKSGHSGQFVTLCKAVGLEGGDNGRNQKSYTCTVPSIELTVYLEQLVADIGPIPHAALNPKQSGKKVQKNRQLLVLCSACGWKFRASQKAISAMTSCKCLSCGENQLSINYSK